VIRLLHGDCRETLPTLESGSVQCAISSPPYWGLRDYGTPPLVWGGDAEHLHVFGDTGHSNQRLRNGLGGSLEGGTPGVSGTLHPQTGSQCSCGAWLGSLGLEPTPELYIQHLVECLRAVRRVLRDDGTLWLNLGSAYAGSGKGPTGRNGIGDQSVRQGFVGSRRVPAYGIDGTTPADCRLTDSAYSDLCDGCRGAIGRQDIHNADTSPRSHVYASRLSQIARDTARRDYDSTLPLSSPPDDPESTTLESLPQPPDVCLHCANCGACLSVLRSSSRDARLCVRRESHMLDTAQRESVSRNQHKDASDSAHRDSTIAFHPYQPKDEMLIPFRAALALQADGWIVRSVIPWLKRNSMPESVTDRPSTSVEYVFLLAKSARYYWDGDAVRQGISPHTNQNRGGGIGPKNAGIEMGIGSRNNKSFAAATSGVISSRNRRNSDWWFESWQGLLLDEADDPLALVVNPQPYSGAHFATFPPKLVKPMIQASTRPDDVVLDPFSGAGTVGLVADRLQRDAILCELSDDYRGQATARVVGDAPLFVQMEGG
jgi:DNA modification methylase